MARHYLDEREPSSFRACSLCFSVMATQTLINILQYIALLIICPLFRYSLYRILQQSHQMQRSPLLVRHVLQPNLLIPHVRTTFLYSLYCSSTPIFLHMLLFCLENFFFWFLRLTNKTFSLALVFCSQFVRWWSVEFKHWFYALQIVSYCLLADMKL